MQNKIISSIHGNRANQYFKSKSAFCYFNVTLKTGVCTDTHSVTIQYTSRGFAYTPCMRTTCIRPELLIPAYFLSENLENFQQNLY